MIFNYDVIVIGAGHAGCEAACAAANMGSRTLLITMDMNKIGQMSCNPAIGGIAKGQIVREIDALGGFIGIVTDATAIQFRMLNKSKGPAMWSPRSQSDRMQFIIKWREILDATPNLDIWQDTVTQLHFSNGVVTGCKTSMNVDFKATSVVLTTGTFLNGLMHIGKTQLVGGRIAEPSSFGVTEQLKEMGFSTDRMKTGTPVRLNGNSIDFSKMAEQVGEDDFHKFSFLDYKPRPLPQRSCWITYTNSSTHEILRGGLPYSPLYNGQIQSIGPRYCPSIETKIVTFADKDQHQLFLEPEGAYTQEYYLNGFSSSLPIEVQFEALKTVPGLENVKAYRPGYAIEYDFFDPTQLTHTLETKLVKNLFFAGQINGTTGYEEAAGQGLIAGMNAHINCHGGQKFILSRDEAYIGVLIDDLVTKGVDEPYRMFTSRAEYRILLRQDNADERLTPKGYELGLVSKERLDIFNQKLEYKNLLFKCLDSLRAKIVESDAMLESLGTDKLEFSQKLSLLLIRPQVYISSLIQYFPKLKSTIETIPEWIRNEVIDKVEIEIKYGGYISREKQQANKLSRLENIVIKDRLIYSNLRSEEH